VICPIFSIYDTEIENIKIYKVRFVDKDLFIEYISKYTQVLNIIDNDYYSIITVQLKIEGE